MISILRQLFSHFANSYKDIFTFSGSHKLVTFDGDMFDTFSGSRQFDTFSVEFFYTFSVDLKHLAELFHLA